MRKQLLAFAVSAVFSLPITVSAQTAPAAEPAPPYTFTGNFGIFSQYIFRGLTQTNRNPAVQGGFDYTHSSGLYAGTWLSNISWLTDSPAVSGYSSAPMEWDFYGGYRGTFGKSDFGYDVGLLQYYYPGTHSTTLAPGTVKADTLEAYGLVGWKWLSAKYSYGLDTKTFGVPNSRGTSYLDLSANYPLTEKLTFQAHYGKQKYDGIIAGVSNDSVASYEDYKLGLSYALPKDFTVGGYYTNTHMTALQKGFYTNISDNRNVGKDAVTVFVQKTF
ncbi:MAG: TorF family putative porin [Pseudomonadota bacterium]